MEASSPYASPSSIENIVRSSIPDRRQGQKNSQSPSASSRHMPNIPTTPQSQARMQPPTSAPQARSRTHLLLTSPKATRRSKESLETFRVARTLKEGLLRLKARADPQATQPGINLTTWRRPTRTFSATTAGAVAAAAAGNNNNLHAGGVMSRRPLLRHHSEIPSCMSMRSPDRPYSRAPSAASPLTTAVAAGGGGLPAPMPAFRSQKSRPTPIHFAHSHSQQHRLIGRTNSDGLLLSPVASSTRSPQPPYSHHNNTRPVPRLALDQATDMSPVFSTSYQSLRMPSTANSPTGPLKRTRSPEDEYSQHSEVAEAAETMILFMKSEASSQNDLSTSSFSPQQLNQHSPSISPLIPSASETGTFSHQDILTGHSSSPPVGPLLGNSQFKRPRSGAQTPS
ncbi:hypothetical protein EV175_005084 [Coemansia sp. RSA 1933]|nr:hypothetical protein EV175_005084 [Coemansia sp. RSA 1933]